MISRNALALLAPISLLVLTEIVAERVLANPNTSCINTSRLFTEYNPDIQEYPALNKVKEGQLVEFEPSSVPNLGKYLKGVADHKALPEWYWGGGNCRISEDCNELADQGVELGSTGTTEWDVAEQRILGSSISHPASIKRAQTQMESALRLAAKAGTDLIFRIDNLHDLNDKRFYSRNGTEVKDLRDFQSVAQFVGTWEKVVTQLRKDKILSSDKIYGLSAHNNLKFWNWYVDQGGLPPVVLRLENPTQFPDELAEGEKLSAKIGVPFLGIEFRKGHLYNPTDAQLQVVLEHVSQLMVMANEDNYRGGPVFTGKNPIENIRAPETIRCQLGSASP